jgi:hypothetical protein
MSENDEMHDNLACRIGSVEGLTTAMFNFMEYAVPSQHEHSTSVGRLSDADRQLQQAMDEVSSENPDRTEVFDRLYDAAQFADRFRKGLDDEVKEIDVPSFIDANSSMTFGELAHFYASRLNSIRHQAHIWCEKERAE